jgi:hypothetical protein
MTKTVLYPLIVTGVIVLTWLGRLNAQQSRGEAVSIGTDDIGGVVTGTNGPEAGVRVIADAKSIPPPSTAAPKRASDRALEA